MEVLSEQLCQGWLEGCLLAGRLCFFASYEAFALDAHADYIREHFEDLPEVRGWVWSPPPGS